MEHFISRVTEFAAILCIAFMSLGLCGYYILRNCSAALIQTNYYTKGYPPTLIHTDEKRGFYCKSWNV